MHSDRLLLALCLTVLPLAACNDDDDDAPPAVNLFDGYGVVGTQTYETGSAIANLTPVNPDPMITGYSVAPALPSGLSLDPVTGVISGTPDTVTAVANYTVTATDGTDTDDEVLSIEIIAPVGPDFFDGYGTMGTESYPILLAIADLTPINVDPAVTGFTVAPALPSGLTLDPLTGVISGTPDALAAATDYTVTATDGTDTDDEIVSIEVREPVVSISSDRDLVRTRTVGTVTVPPGGTPVAETAGAPATGAATLTEVATPTAALAELVDLEDVPGTSAAFVPSLSDGSADFTAVITIDDSELAMGFPWMYTAAAPYDDDGLNPAGASFGFDTSAVVVEDATLALDVELAMGAMNPAVGPFSTNALPTEDLELRTLTDPLIGGVPAGEWYEQDGVFYGSITDFLGNDKLYAFTPDDGVNPATLDQITDTNPSGDDAPIVHGSFGSQLVISALFDDTVNPVVRAAFLYDPAGPSLTEFADIATGSESIGEVAEVGGELYFSAVDDGGDRDLYRYDPTGPTVERVSSTAEGPPTGDLPAELTALGGELYYTAEDTGGMRRLWNLDPATDTQSQLTGDDGVNPRELTVLDGILYLVAEDTTNSAAKLFRWDDADGRIEQITDFQGDAASSDAPEDLFTFAGDLYFTALRPTTGVRKLHRYQPNAMPLRAELLSNTAGDTNDDNIQDIVTTGSEVVFRANNPNGALKLWSFNDANGEVRQLVQFNDDMTADEFTQLLPFGTDKLAVVTSDSVTFATKLAVYDSGDRTIVRAVDLAGVADDQVQLRGTTGDSLLFTATDGLSNPRLYSIE